MDYYNILTPTPKIMKISPLLSSSVLIGHTWDYKFFNSILTQEFGPGHQSVFTEGETPKKFETA